MLVLIDASLPLCSFWDETFKKIFAHIMSTDTSLAFQEFSEMTDSSLFFFYKQLTGLCEIKVPCTVYTVL